jgi:hypothetical protein
MNYISSGYYTFTCLAFVTLPGAHAPASTALRIICVVQTSRRQGGSARGELLYVLFIIYVIFKHIRGYVQKHVFYGRFKGFSRVILTIRDFGLDWPSLERNPA